MNFIPGLIMLSQTSLLLGIMFVHTEAQPQSEVQLGTQLEPVLIPEWEPKA